LLEIIKIIIFFLIFKKILIVMNDIIKLGIGDWGLGIGDWAQSPKFYD
jgi:hypothetical protein